MDKAREGGCQCGAIRYRSREEPIVLAVCHCKECQRQSGSAFGMSLVVPKDSFEILRGEVKTFSRSSDSGRTVVCAFCPTCGTRIYHQATYLPNTLNIKPGTLDDTSWLQPDLHAWTKSKQSWVPIPEGANCVDGQP